MWYDIVVPDRTLRVECCCFYLCSMLQLTMVMTTAVRKGMARELRSGGDVPLLTHLISQHRLLSCDLWYTPNLLRNLRCCFPPLGARLLRGQEQP